MHQAFSLLLLAAVSSVCLSLLFFHALTRVPSWPPGEAEAADAVALLRDADLSASAMIYDLGCGWGSLLIALSKAFPDAHIKGVEISLFPCFAAWVRTRNIRNVSVTRSNFYACDLADAGAVTCYLMPSVMPKLSKFLDSTVRSGTAVVTSRSGSEIGHLKRQRMVLVCAVLWPFTSGQRFLHHATRDKFPYARAPRQSGARIPRYDKKPTMHGEAATLPKYQPRRIRHKI